MRLLILFIVMLLFGIIPSEKGKNLLEQKHLKGRVKEYTETCYSVKKGDSGSAAKYEKIYIMNYKIDTLGRLFDFIQFGSDGKIGVETREIYQNDQLIQVETLPAGLDIYKIEDNYKYDKSGNRVKEEEYKKGILYCITISEYDGTNNKIKEEVEYRNHSEDAHYLYKYDARGNKVEQKESHNDFPYEEKCEFRYDSLGNQVEETRYLSEKYEKKFTKKYNTNNEVIAESCIDSSGSTRYSYTYQYMNQDKFGNWLKKVKMSNGEMKEMVDRKIFYY